VGRLWRTALRLLMISDADPEARAARYIR